MKEKDMKSQREPARQILSPRALQKPERKSAVLRDHLQICICEDKVLPWSQCVTKGLLPVVEGGCKVLHVPKLVDFREPKETPKAGSQTSSTKEYMPWLHFVARW